MIVPFVLIQKILSLFLVMMLGIAVVRKGLLQPEDSRGLSVITLYLAFPCAIISAFCVDKNSISVKNLVFTVLISTILHVIMILMTKIICKFYPLTRMEQACIIYTNCGGMVIPLVSAIQGEEWVVYSTGYIMVQLFFVWSHGKMLLCGEKKPDLLKIIRNPNMIAVFVGIFLLFFRIQIPVFISDAMGYLEDMVAGSGMLIAGMFIGNINLKKVGNLKRIWVTCLTRMVLCPLVCLLFLKLGGMEQTVQNGQAVLFATFIATTTPSALTIMQMAQVYEQDAEYCGVLNIVTTIIGILTIPAFLLLYQM